MRQLLLLLLLLSRVSHIWLCATPQTAAHQTPPSLGFSRQEHWSGLPFPSPMHDSEKWKWSCSAVPDSSDPMDCSLPGSSVHGIFQARVLEAGAIAFSIGETRKWLLWEFTENRRYRAKSTGFYYAWVIELLSYFQKIIMIRSVLSDDIEKKRLNARKLFWRFY